MTFGDVFESQALEEENAHLEQRNALLRAALEYIATDDDLTAAQCRRIAQKAIKGGPNEQSVR